MKIIIAGRDFTDLPLMVKTMDQILENQPDVTIISGCARGADALGMLYAKLRKLPVERFPADWQKYGKQAGYLRNIEMANRADALVAFWDGRSGMGGLQVLGT